MTSQPHASSAAPVDDGQSVGHDRGPETLSTLRGAGVAVDGRRAALVVIAACLVGLLTATVVLFVAGADKNAQITRLHQQGVPVKVTVTSCFGLLGGSGSNGAGYACRGTFTLDGHRHDVAIPGTATYSRGATIHGVAVPDDPSLFSTPDIVAGEHSSWRVFVLPIVLLALSLFAGAFTLLWRQNRKRRSQPTG